MICVRDALEQIDQLFVGGTVESIPTEQAAGRVVAEPLRAQEDAPSFRKAAMDGYAVRSADLEDASDEQPVELELVETVPAGHPVTNTLSPGETMRIFTGAPVPDGADAVVMQEHVEAPEDNEVVRFFEPVSRTNIRPKGDELEEGTLLVDQRTVLSPSAVGLLIEQGYTEIPVFGSPSVSIVNTGDELIPPDQQPSPGEVRDSIGPALSALVRMEGIEADRHRVVDDRDELARVFESVLDQQDVVFISGGVSVGDRDLTREVLEEQGVEPMFHGVRQKPGKPLLLGRRDDTVVLGLPGNPVSSLVCYWMYGRPILRSFAGYPPEHRHLSSVTTTFDDPSMSRPKRTVFARARTTQSNDGFESRALKHQGSHMLSGLASANSLVRVPPTERDGLDQPRAYLFPDRFPSVLS